LRENCEDPDAQTDTDAREAPREDEEDKEAQVAPEDKEAQEAGEAMEALEASKDQEVLEASKVLELPLTNIALV